MLHHWIKLRGQRYINFMLNTSQKYETRILETPGLWMSDVELSDLRESLNAVASRTIPDKQLDYGIFAKEGGCAGSHDYHACGRKEDRQAGCI